MLDYSILKTEPSSGYALLDSGEGEKLERYGEFIVARPDPQALWRKNLSVSEWNRADAWFRRDSKSAEWQTRGKISERWAMEFGGLKFWIKLSAFKHTGLFPEHEGNWKWIRNVILNGAKRSEESLSKSTNGQRSFANAQDDRVVRVLNLFGYTGGATLAAAKVGAEVVHVDGSKVAISWARDNAALSGLDKKPIRWILDDAVKFVKREIKRGNKYHGIIMDPPAFGHGPGGELWKIEDNFLELLDLCKQILASDAIFILVNGYASGYSALAYQNSLSDLTKNLGGKVEIGELTIEEHTPRPPLNRGGGERLLPCGIFARWSK